MFADDVVSDDCSVFADDVFSPVYLCGSNRPGQNQFTLQYSWSKKKVKMLFKVCDAKSLSMIDLSTTLVILRILSCLISLTNEGNVFFGFCKMTVISFLDLSTNTLLCGFRFLDGV